MHLFHQIAMLPRPTAMRLGIVAALVAVDFLFIGFDVALHVARDTGLAVSKFWLRSFSITTDGAPAEYFNYMKLALLIGMLLSAGVTRKVPVFLVAASAYAYALLDDALMIHERAAGMLTGRSSMVVLFGGLRWQDVGELLTLGVPGLLFVGLIWLAARNRSDEESTFGWIFGGAFVALGGFAVIVDCLHQLLGGIWRIADQVLAVLEDGGEMIVVSLTVAAAFMAFRYAQAIDTRAGRDAAAASAATG